MFFSDMCSHAFICLVLFFHGKGSHPCHLYVQGFSSFKGETKRQWTKESNVLWYLGNFNTNYYYFQKCWKFQNNKNSKKFFLWRNSFRISWNIPGTFHIFNMKISKQNNYSTLKCWTCHGTIVIVFHGVLHFEACWPGAT